MPQELEELADEVAGSDAPGIDDASEDEIEALTLPDDAEPSHEAEAPHADSDIWLGMGNDATPKASERNRQTASRTPIRRSAASRSPSPGTQNVADPFSEADYGYFPPAHSDVSSADEEPTPTRPGEMDTIAQGEDFSMIFMDSIPSLHDSSHHAGKYSDIGEETSIIINNTLESIRKGTNQEVETIEEEQEQGQDRHEDILDDQADDEEADDDQAGAEAEEEDDDEDDDEGDVVGEMNPLEREIPASPSPPPRAQKLPSRSPQQSVRTARGSSQTRKSPSRSPAKPLLVPPTRDTRKTATPSPLRHKVLRNQTIDAVSTHQHADGGSQSAPLDAEESLFVQDREPEQLSYEDSFSEIPQAVLDAATPQKETRTFTDVYESDEQAAEDDDEVEQDYDEVEQEPLEPYNPSFQQTVEVEEDVDEDVEMGDAEGEDYERGEDRDAAEFEVEEQVVDDAEFDDEPEPQPEMVEDDEVEEAVDESPEAESEMEAEVIDEQDEVVEEEDPADESDAEGDGDAELVDERHEDAAPVAFGYVVDADEAPGHEVVAGELVEEPEDIAVEAIEEEEEFEGDFDELPAEIELMGNNGVEYAHSPEHANQPVTLVLESEAREEINLYDDDEASESADNAPVSYDDIARHPYIHPRPPTPDDDPLPVPVPAKSPASFRSHRRQLSITSPLPPQGQLHTEPPQITIAQPSSTPIVKRQTSRSVSRSASSMEATPLNQMSSPVQDPQSVVHELHERNLRPLLSATVRAGRALQSVTSDPPSPDAGDRLLRSPFRRSGSKDSRHGSKERQAARTASRSPSRSLFNTSAPAPVDDEMQIDLNRVSPKSISSPVAAPPPPEVAAPIRTTASPRLSQTSSVRQSPPSDAAMSWVAREGPISPKLRGDNSLRNVYGSPSQRKAPAAQPLPQVDSAADENEGVQAEQAPIQTQTQEENIIRDDETDIWEFEARRSTPRPPRQQFGSKTLTQSARKRGGIPSPWTRKTRQNLAGLGATVSSGVMASQLTATTKVINPTMEPADGEEYSLLARRQAVEEAERGQSSAVKAGRFDLSSFFSSPAAIPGMLAEKFIPGMARPALGGTMAQEEQPPMAQIQTTSMFPSVASQPQRTPARSRLDSESDTASTPRPRVQPPAQSSPELELRLELEPTPEPEMEREPTPEPEVEPEPEPTPQPAFQPTPRARPQIVVQPRSILKSQPRRPPRPSIRPAPRVAEPKSPEAQATTPVIAQKQNFTPRTTPRSTRQTDNSFFQGSSARAAAATPPRMQLSHDDIRRWQQEMSSASDESTDFVKPFLRPLPPKNASPKKSSLRSPLKPHTPGRVVEFTSSVLSPLEQAKARHERRMSNASTPQNHSLLSGPRVSSNVSDKENRESVASASGSAASSARSVAVPLSQTTWTRQHWLFLDWLIQTRREAPFEEPYDRSADKYLGKVVRAQGMAMALERWHLDCVDAFTEEVGGWEVGYIIKRLFALLLGEERRTQSQTQELMFH